MSKEDVLVVKFFKDNIGWILTGIGTIFSIITGSYCLWVTCENYFKSVIYHVDFSFFQVSFNIYHCLFILFSCFAAFIVVYSIHCCIRFLWNRCIKKKREKIPKLEFITIFGICIIFVILSIFLSIIVACIFFFKILFVGEAFFVVGKVMLYTDKKQSENFDMKKEFHNFCFWLASSDYRNFAMFWKFELFFLCK